MKTFKQLFIVLTISTFVFACSSDDSSDPAPTNPPTDNTGNYFPLTVGDFWDYDVTYTDNMDSNNNFNSMDNLFVASETSNMYDLGVNTNDIANGAMNGILVNGTLERMESTLELDGSLAIPFPGFESNSIDFTDMVLYDLNAANNSELASTSGSLSQEIDAGGTIGLIEVTIDYTVSSRQINNNSSITVNGVSYSEASKTTFKLTMSVSIPNPLIAGTSIPLIQNQDVTVATNYFVENIGLVKSETAIEYQVSQTAIEFFELAGIDIPFPTSGSAANVQEMTDYMVTIE